VWHVSQEERHRHLDPDDRYVAELRLEQEATHCKGCELASRCLASGSNRRTVWRLEKQSVMDEQKQKMASEAGVKSGRSRKMRIERRYGDSKKHRGAENGADADDREQPQRPA